MPAPFAVETQELDVCHERTLRRAHVHTLSSPLAGPSTDEYLHPLPGDLLLLCTNRNGTPLGRRCVLLSGVDFRRPLRPLTDIQSRSRV